jgi:acetyl-CoA carboxylase / biotin carboxylase 1
MGVISVETRTTESLVYADPALETSQEEVIKEAGQVWYPNSAAKTAQAIRDFNYGEQLPMIIFANWRGFSGGQSDMFKEVLKFGAQIVDALREFKQPIFIYIIGELRGGAWVVVDPSINSKMMEMYTYENGRGGVLEPQGIVEIKYRIPKVIATMQRLDEDCRKMKESIASTVTETEKVILAENLKKRQEFLLPVYEQAAVELADLHDRPARMVGKGVVRKIITWEQSRIFFYWRVSRRLNTMLLVKKIERAAHLTSNDAEELINSWFSIAYPNGTDKEFGIWYIEASPTIEDRIDRLKQIYIRDEISKMAKDSPAAFMEALATSFHSFTQQEKQDFFDRLSQF